MDQLKQFRQEVDEFMAYQPQSPLDHKQRHDFQGLNYYDPSDDLSFEVEVNRLPEDSPPIIMETNTGDKTEYRRYGNFTLEVDGEEATLTLFIDPHGGFFLPFRDATSGKETYGAGRYLDDHRPAIQKLNGERFRIDFNYAYNPYCAYSPYYSCPLPPTENWLRVPIRAGEKDFK